jgi:uncharacterized protein (DUF305 family)
MNKILFGALMLMIGVVLGFSVGGIYYKNNQLSTNMHQMPNGRMMHGIHDMSQEMESMMSKLQDKTGDDFDKAFLSEMIIHHQGAIQMSESALINAKHQEIKDLASEIINAQNKEIEQMKEWLKNWYN